MAQSELSKAIKRLNERIADFERHKTTESSQYKTIISTLESLKDKGLEVRSSAKGNTAIRNIAYSDDLTRKLISMSKNRNTYGRAKKQAVKMLKEQGRTTQDIEQEDINEVLQKTGKAHEIIVNHSKAVYLLEDEGEIELHKEKRGKRLLTIDEVDTIIEKVGNATDEQRQEMEKKHEENVRLKTESTTEKSLNEQLESQAKDYGTTAEVMEQVNDFYNNLPSNLKQVPQIEEIIGAFENGTINQLKRRYNISI